MTDFKPKANVKAQQKSELVSKLKLYEATVQSPEWQVDYLPQFHRYWLGRDPRSFREDFCGSARIACEWVKRSPRNTAIGLDLDPETLAYGENVNRAALKPSEQKRVRLLKRDVLRPMRAPSDQVDMIGAFNSSFFDFHDRKTLLKYARAAHESLKKQGTLFMELGGGEGFLEPHQESRVIKVPGVGRVEQFWEQHQYDPITGVNDYSIHFKLPGGVWINDAFTYHWRVWGIREIREVLQDAGFAQTAVLWDQSAANEARTGTRKLRDLAEVGEYLPTENAERLHSWVAYVVGIKGAKSQGRN